MLKHRWKTPALGGMSWGLIDQLILSIFNFGVMLIIARKLGPEGFGVFTLIFTTAMLVVMLQRSLIGTPHNVIGQRLETRPYRDFTRSAAMIQLALLGLVLISCVVAAVVTQEIGDVRPGLILATFPFMASLMWLEFVRRVLYTEGRFRDAATCSLMVGGLQLLALALLVATRNQPSVTSVLLALSGAALLAGALATAFIWVSLAGTASRAHTNEILGFGGWLGGSALISGLGSQLYLYAIALLLSPAALGSIRAADTLVRPIGVVSTFLESVLPARFSKAFHDAGLGGLLERVNIAGTWFMSLVVACMIALLIWGESLMGMVFGAEYLGFAWLPVIYPLFYLFTGLGSVLSSGIRSLEYGRVLFNISAWVTVSTIPLSLLLAANFGLYGAVAGLILPAFVRLVTLGRIAATRLSWKPALSLGRTG